MSDVVHHTYTAPEAPPGVSDQELAALELYTRDDVCLARARKGTGEGTCGRRLDENGYCDRPNDHIG